MVRTRIRRLTLIGHPQTTRIQHQDKGIPGNEAVIHKVRVTLGCYNKGGSRVLVFTKHGEDLYTVFGLTPSNNAGISIERRKYEEKVRGIRILWLIVAWSAAVQVG